MSWAARRWAAHDCVKSVDVIEIIRYIVEDWSNINKGSESIKDFTAWLLRLCRYTAAGLLITWLIEH